MFVWVKNNIAIAFDTLGLDNSIIGKKLKKYLKIIVLVCLQENDWVCGYVARRIPY